MSVPVSGFALLSKNPKRAMPSVIVTARLEGEDFAFCLFHFPCRDETRTNLRSRQAF